MKSVLISLFLAFAAGGLVGGFSHAVVDTGSAYERLRVQFDRGQKPESRDLQPGKIWYCSGSLEAAKGQFRYVAFWEARYKFQKDEAQQTYVNRMDSLENWFDSTETDLRGIRVLGKNLREYEFLRRNRQGDLIIEVAATPNQGGAYARQSRGLRAAVSSSQLKASQYVICENPESHENRNWGTKPFDQIGTPSY